MRYIIRDREAGNELDERDTLIEAEELIAQFEEEDREDGTYTQNFYEIVEVI